MDSLSSMNSTRRMSLASAGRILLLVAMVLCYVGLSTKLRTGLALATTGFIFGLLYSPFIIYERVIVPLIWGVQCPTCREWTMKRVASITFGNRFYRCESCGQRCKRSDHDSPWLDAWGKEDDDMFKPIPYFGPSRRREASREALKVLLVIGGMVVCPILGGYIGGDRGAVLVSIVFWAVLFSSSRSNQKDEIPTRPVLWDREFDH